MTLHPARALPGSDRYWADRKAAFRLIAELEAAMHLRSRASHYIAGPGYDPQTAEGLIENIGPWDRVADLQDRGRLDLVVVEILSAQRRLDLLEN